MNDIWQQQQSTTTLTSQQQQSRNLRKPDDPIKTSIVSNERIRHLEVRVVGEDGSQLGIMSSKQALWNARNKGLDLVEITATANPPVVRIVDLNKWIYNLRQSKKEQDRKARENAIVIKEIQLRPVTDKHDLAVKQEHAKNFLAANNKVKVVIKFKGRELNFAQKGFEIIESFINGVGSCKIEKSPELNGRAIIAILSPQRGTEI